MIYRVFVTRHYIATDFYDVEAKTSKIAENLVRKAARKLQPDVRAIACDNQWQNDDAVEISELGYSSVPFEVELVFETKKGRVYYRSVK